MVGYPLEGGSAENQNQYGRRGYWLAWGKDTRGQGKMFST